jgi:hypothetical protein
MDMQNSWSDPSPVLAWWAVLCSIALVNVSVWLLVGRRIRAESAALDQAAGSDLHQLRRWQWALAGAYVLGCAWRSLLPVFDVQRLCLVDSPLSSIFVGRSVATVAELAFVAQWALLLGSIARAGGSEFARLVARTMVPLIVVAEVFSWSAVLTTNNIGHVIEESLWATCAVLFVFAALLVAGRTPQRQRPLLLALCVGAIVYALYMIMVDVPMYASRWLASEAAGHAYLGWRDGLADALYHRAPSWAWADWQSEIGWMTAYFSVGVWCSIALTRMPDFQCRRGSDTQA